MIRLATNKSGRWGVYTHNDFLEFSTIELASDYLMNSLNVKDEEIDEALIQMSGYEKRVAIFNDNGYFVQVADS